MVDNSCGVIRDAVFSDVPVNDAAPGHLDILRKTLAVTFTNDFLKSLCDGSSGLQWCKTDAEKKFHQMFRKVGDEQPGKFHRQSEYLLVLQFAPFVLNLT